MLTETTIQDLGKGPGSARGSGESLDSLLQAMWTVLCFILEFKGNNSLKFLDVAKFQMQKNIHQEANKFIYWLFVSKLEKIDLT